MDYIHGAIVDNWSLELAGALLADDARYKSTESNEELVQALFDFLDILVLNENIVYETAFSHVWEEKQSLKSIKPFTVAVTAIKKGETEILIFEGIQRNRTQHRRHFFESQEKIIADGAKFYLAIAEALGVQYWPAPKRQQYIDGLHKSPDNEFIFLLDSDIKTNISSIASQMSQQFPSIKPTILPGFGAKVLADCEDPKSVIPAAIQLREDPYCVAFREWCRQMDYHLETGNVVALHKSMKDVSLLFNDISKRFSVSKDDAHNSGVKLQLGLRPSVSIDGHLIGSLLGKFLPKKMHLVFLRRHIEGVLQNTNIAYHVERLFSIKAV
jgi:hypothetical protein